MRSALFALALVMTFSFGSLPTAAAAKGKKAPARAGARKRVHDPVAAAYKQEQMARLVYWISTYRRTLAALAHGVPDPIRPYPRQPIIEALSERMSPGAQAYARRLQDLEKRTMAKHAPAAAVSRETVIKGILAILAGLREEQRLLEAMPVYY